MEKKRSSFTGSVGFVLAAAALKEFAESFQGRNPHLRVFNMVLHSALPHRPLLPQATRPHRAD